MFWNLLLGSILIESLLLAFIIFRLQKQQKWLSFPYGCLALTIFQFVLVVIQINDVIESRESASHQRPSHYETCVLPEQKMGYQVQFIDAGFSKSTTAKIYNPKTMSAPEDAIITFGVLNEVQYRTRRDMLNDIWLSFDYSDGTCAVIASGSDLKRGYIFTSTASQDLDEQLLPLPNDTKSFDKNNKNKLNLALKQQDKQSQFYK